MKQESNELQQLLTQAESEKENESKLNDFLSTSVTKDPKKIGKLQSKISAKVHTKQAAQLIQGHKIVSGDKASQNYKAMGLYSFSTRSAILEAAIKKDDPYADLVFYYIHEEVNVTRQELKEKITYFKNWIKDSIPKSLEITEVTNIKPVEMDFKFNSAMAFQVMYLILELDEYFRLIKLAQHIALIDTAQANKTIQDNRRNVRRIMNMVSQYKHTDVTRNDIAANNQRAQKAAQVMPSIELTEDILGGTKRSTLAPFVAARPELLPINEEEQS